MRSYSYHDGAWQSISDPLATVLIEPSPMTGGLKTYEFSQALKPYGFSEYGGGVTIACRLGDISIYVRDHQRLTATRQAKDFPYDFVCLFTMGTAPVRVWIVDFPTLFLFLAEIDARPQEDKTVLLDRTSLAAMIVSIERLADDIVNGELEVTVKPPKPPTRRA